MDFTDGALTALQVVSPVLVAALTWAAAKLASFIRSKVDNEYLRGVLVRLDDAVVTAVKDLQQTVVAEIKATSTDGKISEAEERLQTILKAVVVGARSGDPASRPRGEDFTEAFAASGALCPPYDPEALCLHQIDLDALDVQSLRELVRLVRDLDHEKQAAVNRARMMPWRR